MDESNSDWIPTLHLGYDKVGTVASNNETLTHDRYDHTKRRRECRLHISCKNLHSLDQELREDDSEVLEEELEHKKLPMEYCILFRQRLLEHRNV